MTTVNLLSSVPAPRYYFRFDHFAALIPAGELIATLEQRHKEWDSPPDGRLLTELREDPVKDQTDLFKYALTDGRHLQRIEYLLAELIQNGQIGLVDVWNVPVPGGMVTTAIVVTVKADTVGQREFCSPEGELLLSVTDYIVD